MESKKIKFTYQDKDITLEYTRSTVEQMERVGFRIDELGDKPMTQVKLLVHGAFLANHRKVKAETIDKIYEMISNKEEFVGKLAEMYNETRETLFAEPEEGDEKNLDWKTNW